MAVKKVLRPKSLRDTVDLSLELDEIRDAILTLPTEGEDMSTPDESKPAAEATTKSAPKKVVKKPAAKAPAKKVAKAAAKPAKPAKSNGAEGTTLATICKGMKAEPRWARRVLRTAEVKNPGRWAWTSASEVAKITKILKEAASA